MSKELPYFRFTAFEWLNGDISLENYQVKGVFSDVCAYYWFKDCSITKAMLEKRFSNALTEIKTLFESGILKFKNGDDYLEISFLNEQFDQLSELRKARQNAGSKGGKQKRSKAKAKLKQKCSYKDKDKDNNKDKDKYRNVPPSIEEVKLRIEERQIKNIDIETFFSHYEANGWKVGKNKMQNWDSALTYWTKNEFRKNENSNGNNQRSIKRVNDLWNK
jgi:hypothetical protein